MSDKNKYRVRLVRWGDSSSSGRTVTFKLPDDDDEHPFKGLDVGAKNGQLLEMEIAIYEGDGDVESLDNTKKPRADTKPRLPVVKDEPKPPTRRRAKLENITRRVIPASASASEPDRAEDQTEAPDAGEPGSTASEMPNDSTASDNPASDAVGGHGGDMDHDPGTLRNGSGFGEGTGGGGNLNSEDLDSYASQMGQAAEALAAVAERLDDQVEEEPQFPTIPIDGDDDLDPGVKAVRRATDLCKAIDKQRAGFYYFMRSRYPQAPKLTPEKGEWSRDAKSTRDRVCLHCEADNLGELAQDPEARRKFEELENEFERHERLR